MDPEEIQGKEFEGMSPKDLEMMRIKPEGMQPQAEATESKSISGEVIQPPLTPERAAKFTEQCERILKLMAEAEENDDADAKVEAGEQFRNLREEFAESLSSKEFNFGGKGEAKVYVGPGYSVLERIKDATFVEGRQISAQRVPTLWPNDRLILLLEKQLGSYTSSDPDDKVAGDIIRAPEFVREVTQ